MTLHLRPLAYILCLVLCLSACKNLKEVECTGLKGFQINQVNTKGINADLLLGLKNPNNVGFSIYRSDFDVTYSGIYLGKARLGKRVHIKAHGEGTYRFNLKSDFKNINLGDLMKLIGGANSGGMVEVKGDLKAGKFYLKKKFPINIKERP